MLPLYPNLRFFTWLTVNCESCNWQTITSHRIFPVSFTGEIRCLFWICVSATNQFTNFPHPLTGCQEYRDIHCQNLRALVYPNRITLAFRATINNQRIYETLGQFPQLCVEDARQHVMKLLADKNRLAVQSRRLTVEQAIMTCGYRILQLYKKSPQSELSKLNLYVRPFWGQAATSRHHGRRTRTICCWLTGKITSVNSKPYPRNIVQNMLSGSTCWMDHAFPDDTCPLSERK